MNTLKEVLQAWRASRKRIGDDATNSRITAVWPQNTGSPHDMPPALFDQAIVALTGIATGSVRDGLPGNSGDAPTLDTDSIWRKHNGKAANVVADADEEDEAEVDETPPQPTAAELHDRAYARFNNPPKRAPRT